MILGEWFFGEREMGSFYGSLIPVQSACLRCDAAMTL